MCWRRLAFRVDKERTTGKEKKIWNSGWWNTNGEGGYKVRCKVSTGDGNVEQKCEGNLKATQTKVTVV